MTFSLFSVKLFFMYIFLHSLLKTVMTHKNSTLINSCAFKNALSSLFLCFLLVLNISGCEEKKEIIIREVKEEVSKTAAPAAIPFDLSKVVPKTDAGYLDVIDPTNASVDTDIHVGGWAADLKKKVPAKAVIALFDGKQATVTIRMGIERKDIAKAFKNGSLARSGWDGGFNTSTLGKGKHRLEFYAVLDNGNFVPLKHKGKRFVEILVTDRTP
jgi:hypothetical protein